MTDDDGSKVFDLPHARVTLTPVGSGIEIEVWPKQGQSAYAVVDPAVAILIARQLAELAVARLAAADEEPPADTAAATDGDDDEADDADGRLDNVVDLASRRRPVS